MADSYIPATAGSGLNIDSEQLTVGSNPNLHRQRVQITGATGAAVGVVTNADPSTSDYAQAVRLVNQVAHHSADGGSPVKIGGTAISAAIASVDEGDRVNAWFSLQGELHTVATRELSRMTGDQAGRLAVSRAWWTGALVAGTGQQIIAAQGSGKYAYVVGLFISNGAAATRLLTIEQGSGAGTQVWGAYIAAGGSISVFPEQILCQSTANSPLFVDIDTNSSVTISVHYVATTATL